MTYPIEYVESFNQRQKLQSRLQLQPEMMFYHGSDKRSDTRYLVASDPSNKNVVGVLAINDSAEFPDYLELSFCEVSTAYLNKKIATRLVEEFFTLAAARSMPVTVTPYEDDGVAYLKPLVQRFAQKYKVYVHEQGVASDLYYDFE
jgi:hypothetical protein